MDSFAELEPAAYARVEPLMAPLADLHGSVPAVLDGAAEGRVRVDSPDNPRVALLDGPEGLYLGGEPYPDLDWAALRASIHPLAYLTPAEAWLPVIDKVLPHPFMLRHQRVTLSLDLATVAGDPPQSGRFEIRSKPDELTAEVFDGETMVAHCHEDMVVGDRAEVGVWTDPRYRRQGLARLAVAGLIALARERGLRRLGWHCVASNKGSLGTARASGFSMETEYVAYAACLDAENRGDHDAARWTELAVHFERGAAQIPLLRIYAAEALSSAGRTDEALTALERLVETEWDGKADWIEGSQLLEPLHGDPRFARAVARQRETELRPSA